MSSNERESPREWHGKQIALRLAWGWADDEIPDEILGHLQELDER